MKKKMPMRRTKMKWRFPQTERAQKNENIYLIKRKFASLKKQTIYVSHFVVKSVYVISFPIQYCFLKAWILKNTIFMIKKVWFLFLVNERTKKKMNYVRIQEEEKNKYERTNVIQMFFSEMRLFVQKIIAFWMSASLVWVLGGCTPKLGGVALFINQATPLAQDLSPAHKTQDVCSTNSYSLSLLQFLLKNNN